MSEIPRFSQARIAVAREGSEVLDHQDAPTPLGVQFSKTGGHKHRPALYGAVLPRLDIACDEAQEDQPQ